MAHIQLREQVIKLRLEGKTYGQIKRELGVAKSTLNNWLSKLPLTKTQQEQLAKNKLLAKDFGIEKFIQAARNKRLARLKDVYKNEVKNLLPLTNKELFLIGAFLYWGEGDKRHGNFSISNTDPRIVKFALYWIVNILKIPLSKVKARLQLYKDMNIEESILFWSKQLNLPIEQFPRPYIKKSNRLGLTYKSFGHGTCRLYLCDVHISEKIAMSIKAVSDFYGTKDEIFWYN